MADIPTTSVPGQLLTLGMFIFAVDSAAYNELQRRQAWRFATSERHGARPAAQFTGPGEDTITLPGTIVPEVAGQYVALRVLETMAGTGNDYPLIDGLGRVWGHYRIVRLDQTHRAIMAGGLPRAIDFSIELERVDG